MEYISNIYQNVILYVKFFFEKFSCRTKPYVELNGYDYDDIESVNFNKIQR